MKHHVSRKGWIDDVLSELGSGQHGVFLGTQAAGRGVGREALRHRVALGRVVWLKTNIFRLRDHPWTWESQLQASLFDAGPGSIISHRSAARLHGFWRYRRTEAVEVSVHEFHDHLVTLGRLHRSSLRPQAHRVVVAGFPVTSVARTCFDLIGDPDPGLRRSVIGAELHEKAMARVVNDALARHDMTLSAFAAVTAVLAKRGRPGSALSRHLIRSLGDDYEPLTSEGEMLVAELVDVYGVDEPERQVRLSDEQGFIGDVDFMWRRDRLVLEVDGRTHDGPLDRRADAARDERVAALGYEVWRWKYRKLVVDAHRLMNDLIRRLAESRVDSGAMAPKLIQHSQEAS